MVEKTDNIKTFRDILIGELSKILENEGYKYKSTKETFEKILDNNVFRIYIYPTKWSKHISVDIKPAYGNRIIENKLKTNGIKLDSDIIRSDLKNITEHYFNKSFYEEYSSLIYRLNEPIGIIIQKILKYYQNIIKPFFADCIEPVKLNKMVNDEDIEKVGLNLNYKTRALNFYYVGIMAGLDKNKLEELAALYENKLKKMEAYYFNDYMKLMEIELKENKKE
jgi:hypothetical protein